ncbi:MAG: acyl-CoA dehydrogenase family protein, partial [Acidimicrobiales bacterium]
LIGNGSIVMHRVVVRTRAIVAANSVVLNDTEVPAGALALGSPAKIREGKADPVLRQRLARLHIEQELLRLIRLRTVTARIKGEPPGAEASVRKIMADEHGQAIMGLAKDLAGAGGMLSNGGPLGGDPAMWHFGFLFAPALTVGGGTGEVQRNIVAERVLGLPHDTDVEQGQTWAQARR